MKVPALLSLAVMAMCATAHDCNVVCDAADKTPVCGSDGKTYQSKCFLEFAKCDQPTLTLTHDHACEGYSGKTLHISISAKKSSEKAREADDDDDDDDDESDSDSEEEEDNTKKKAASPTPTTSTVSPGPTTTTAAPKDKCDKACSRELEQLCASDGKTYNNHCLFEIALCRDPKLKIVDEDGPCAPKNEEKTLDDDDDSDECDKGCTREYDPVCGSDGKTYNNPCLFEIAHCRNSKLKVVKDDGGCEEEAREDKCEKDCTRELEQLCASDGKTYNNKCLFEIAQCRNTTLKIVDEDGPCETKL